MEQYQARCNVCPAQLTPDTPCDHLWMNERGQVYKVHAVHQFEPEPTVVASLVTVTSGMDYQRPDITLKPPPPKKKEQAEP